MALTDFDEMDDEAPKKSSFIPTVAVFLVLSLIGGGAGWVIGGMASANFGGHPMEKKEAEAPAAEAGGHESGEEELGLPHVSTEAGGIYLLEPFVSNLAYPSDRLVRLEVALRFHGEPDVAMAEQIHQDIMRYLPTLSLRQLEGPRGLTYLKEDLEERVEIRSGGAVSDIMLRAFVIQ